MSRLPFGTQYLSTMSQDELLSLGAELEHDSAFWRDELRVKEMVEQYMTRCWRQHTYSPPGMQWPVASNCVLHEDMPSPYLTATFRDIRVTVPDALDEKTARLFVEIMLREQMNPRFDPTEDV